MTAPNDDRVDGREFREIDLSDSPPLPPQPAPIGHYEVDVACENCGFTGCMHAPKGQDVFNTACDKCGCKHKLVVTHEVKLKKDARVKREQSRRADIENDALKRVLRAAVMESLQNGDLSELLDAEMRAEVVSKNRRRKGKQSQPHRGCTINRYTRDCNFLEPTGQ